MPERKSPPPDIIAKTRLVALDLPEAYEEPAWTGVRWCVGKKNFAQLVMIDGGWPPAFAKAAGTDGPACVLTFRVAAAEIAAPRLSRAPYFRPVWFKDIAGLVLDEGTDWDEVEARIVGSYRVLAPKRLAALLDR